MGQKENKCGIVKLDNTSFSLYNLSSDEGLFDLYYFVDHRGKAPVEEFIISLPAKERSKVFAYIHKLQHEGYNLRRPMADYLGNGIYELRPKANRIFFFFFLKDSIVLLHAIRKKTYAVPSSDLELCLKRKAQVEGGQI